MTDSQLSTSKMLLLALCKGGRPRPPAHPPTHPPCPSPLTLPTRSPTCPRAPPSPPQVGHYLLDEATDTWGPNLEMFKSRLGNPYVRDRHAAPHRAVLCCAGRSGPPKGF